MRIKELRSLLSERLFSLENPALEARILLSFFLSMSHSELIINDTREIPEDRERAILDAAALRLEGVPMAYITGKKEFYGYTFSVNSDVLIPQPDTETLVETALDALKGNEKVLDICTGSGAIITSIKAQKPEIMAFFSDISEKALLVAKKNYESITGEKGCCRLGSLFEPWNGMRFNITTFNGRMSCDEARIESITNICSLFSNSIAGRFLCKFKGIFYYVFWSLNIITFCKDNRNIGIKILSRQVSFPETVRQVIRMAESLCGNPSFLRLKRY